MERGGQLAEHSLKEATADVSKKLGLFERVRHVCQSVAIPLPGVVVVGEQSAGKSSLLENISGIQFPRAQNTCTRMPCVLTLLTDPTLKDSSAEVSMDPSFADASKCSVSDVESHIKGLTDKHATGNEFISSQALYVRVVRREGPQLSLIDLPGVTHNADQMQNIHEVTVNLVEEYIKPEKMVILCVIPAMSDLGNAEVVKLARKYDPQGIRTLGVVTKCDDAANAEASDIVEKVLMLRDSDVRLELGFHCVVNRSQKNIDDGMSREDLWNKEKAIFTKKDRMKTLPEKNWGTLNLMERVAKIQEARVDECLPKIKDAVRKKTGELQEELRKLPAQADTEADQFRLFNGILARIRNDLVRRIRAEFMSAETSDRELTIAPIVASMVQSFRKELLERNPDWLGQDMIDEVDDTVQTFVTGYTVENLVGPHVFINLIKQTFIEEGLLKDSVNGLVGDVGEHLRKVVAHVIGLHANINGILANSLDAKAEECIDQLTTKAREVCEMLSEAQQVTSTTHGQYMVKLTQFRKSWFQEAADGVKKFAQALLGGQGQNGEEESELPEEFVRLVEQAQEEPQKLATLEICASLHVYTGFMIEGFVEMSAKLVKFTMVEQLADKLEETWRDQLAGTNLHELFPRDETIVYRQEDLKAKINILRDFKEQMVGLKTAPLPVQKGKQTVAEKARARADAKAEQAKAQVPASSSSAAAAAKKPPAFTWNFAKEVEGKTFRKGDAIKSEKFTLMGVPDLHLSICPQGDSTASEGHMSVYLYAPEGWQIRYKATVQDVERLSSLHTFSSVKSPAWGFADFKSGSTEVALELLEAIPPESKA